MEHYVSYMDRQRAGEGLHRRLLELNGAPVRRRTAAPRRVRTAALAACCALAVGVGGLALSRPGVPAAPEPVPPAATTPAPVDTAPVSTPSEGFVADGGADADPSMFYAIPYVAYADLTGTPQADAALAVPPAGSFGAELSEADIRAVLWGGEVPTDTGGNVPWYLCWDGYVLTGTALYDRDGALLQATLTGDHPDGGYFAIALAPGRLPGLGCCVEPDAAVSEVNGAQAEAWLREDGEGALSCGAAFRSGDVGVRATFSGVSDTLLCDLLLRAYCGETEPPLSLRGLLTADDVPAWRYEELDSLEDARAEADFAPYLPQRAPAGYGDFYGLLSYQEGVTSSLYLRWSRGYADVSVRVSLPEEKGAMTGVLVDPDEPETYDKRLYSIPWADSVPEEHRQSVDHPVFRAEELTRELVEARAHLRGERGEPDALAIDFGILYPDGAVVTYDCEGLTADQVWELMGREG